MLTRHKGTDVRGNKNKWETNNTRLFSLLSAGRSLQTHKRQTLIALRSLIIKSYQGGEMAQLLGAPAALTEDPGSIPSPHRRLTNIPNSSSTRSDTLF